MILKQLELSGFKSFVEPTRLDFTRGFTAVVGPNGCGKSNISDAIRWVIGEQSSKSLRGTRITDLIFNGTANRKPLNRAEISMTLSSVPEGLRIANITNLSEEIKVSRCYHRSGESEFYINEIPCRLKDITDLFLDIGISPKVLTVIEQGHVQDLVTSKPEERRIWIEEAAGVLKFKVRKNEALRKLESSGQNLDRISDIVQELSRQVESLKRQAAKAERYKQYQTEIKDIALNLYAQKLRRFNKELEEVEEALADLREKKTQSAARGSELENRLTQLKVEVDEKVAALNSNREKVHALTSQISKNENAIELEQGKISRAKEDIIAATEEVAAMRQDIENHTQESTGQRQELGQVGDAINEKEEALNQGMQDFTGKKQKHQETEEQLRELEKRVLNLWHDVSRRANALTALETRQETLVNRQEKLVAELADTQGLQEIAQQQVNTAQAGLDQARQGLNAVRQEQESLKQSLDATRSEHRQQAEAVKVIQKEALTQASLLSSLRELRKQFEGFGEGVRSLMGEENGNRVQGLREVLVNVLKAPAEYEVAIEAVMGDKLQSVIVDNYSDSAEALRYLNENKSGRGAFIPMHLKSTPLPPVYLNGDQGVLGKAIDVVEIGEGYQALVEKLLANVVLVKDFDTAMHLHGQEQFQGTVVTLTGEVIDREGVVYGGAKQESDTGLLARNREMDQLADHVQEIEARQGQEEQKQASLAETLRQQEEQLDGLDERVHNAELAVANCNKDVEQAVRELSRLDEKLKALQLESESLKHEQGALEKEQETLKAELSTAETEKTDSENRVAELKDSASEQRQVLDGLSEEINGIQVHLASLKGKRENIMTEIKRLDQQVVHLKERITRREEDQVNNQQRISESEENIAGIENEILEQVREKDALSATVIEQDEKLKELEVGRNQMETEHRTLTHQLQELVEEISKIDLRRSEITLEQSHLEEKAWEEFNVASEELQNEFTEQVDEPVVSKELAELREKVRKLGEVNLAALSDFQVANERYLFLHKQQEDLADSILTLHQTIEKIDETTRRLFLETFEKVNENFKGLFSRLFLGGKAELSLSDPEMPLESGIEITASPAGKSMHNIALLSGGEKTMTAIALIFAILKVRPSPFCLLDEIDAPLDEANVVRFQEMLKEFSDETQFIIITHNQKTMSFANTLYGVTMEEHGVSKVVSVHLNN